MIVAVGSTRPPKVEAVREAFRRIRERSGWPADEPQVLARDVPHSASTMPVSVDELVGGAFLRVRALRRDLARRGEHADLWIGLEGGLNVLQAPALRGSAVKGRTAEGEGALTSTPRSRTIAENVPYATSNQRGSVAGGPSDAEATPISGRQVFLESWAYVESNRLVETPDAGTKVGLLESPEASDGAFGAPQVRVSENGCSGSETQADGNPSIGAGSSPIAPPDAEQDRVLGVEPRKLQGYYASGGGIVVPEALASMVLDQGQELGQAIDAYVGGRDIRSKTGTWGILTLGLVSRRDSFVTALIAALAPFYNSGAYGAVPHGAEPATSTISMKSEAL